MSRNLNLGWDNRILYPWARYKKNNVTMIVCNEFPGVDLLKECGTSIEEINQKFIDLAYNKKDYGLVNEYRIDGENYYIEVELKYMVEAREE